MKKIAQKILKLSAKLTVARNKYKTVAITGSVGKTSTKKAVSLVLSKKFNVLSSDEGYNTEFGLPLILLQKSIPKNKLKWFFLILISPFLALKKRNYDFCILEMGADKVGDIDYLTDLARPNIAIVTNVSKVHLESGQFIGLEDIAREKEKILSRLRKNEVAILNTDSEYIAKMKPPDGTKKITFGKKSTDIQIIGQDIRKAGSLNKFQIKGKDIIIIKSPAIGEHILYIFASAIAVGISQGIALKDIIQSLESFESVKGRLNIIKGLKSSTIIDDSYNANPVSMKNALDVLDMVMGERKIATLGTMGELGEYEKEGHEEIGRYLVPKCDILVTVGEKAKKYLAGIALESGMKKKNIFNFSSSIEAGNFLREYIRQGDIVLAKGSQNASRMEKTIKKIMLNPSDAKNLLCRQGKEWENRS